MKFNEVNVDFCRFYHVNNGIQRHKPISNINHCMVEANFDLQLAIAKAQVIEYEISR